MRIGLVIDRFDPFRGGAESWTYQYARFLIEQGEQVHVVSQTFTPEGLLLPIVPHALGRILSPLHRAAAAEEKLRSLHLDVIHDMGSGCYGDFLQPHAGTWPAMRKTKRLFKPLWWKCFDRLAGHFLPRNRTHQTLLRRQCRQNGFTLLAPSEKVAQEFLQCRFPAENIRVIYHGVDAAAFRAEDNDLLRKEIRRRLPLSEESLLLLAVGHHFELKGVPTLLKAMQRLVKNRRPVHLAIVGGKSTRPWQRRIEQMGLSNNVSLLGSQRNMAPYYAAADIFVHPSLYDSFGLVILEAAACGLPLIVSRECGAAELLRDGRDAFLLDDPTNDERLTDDLGELIDNPNLRRTMGNAARTLAAKHTLVQNFQKIFSFYTEKTTRRAA